LSWVGSGRVQRHVADLARAAARAAHQRAADVDGQAQAVLAEPEQREAVRVAGHAVPAFGDRRQVDIVVHIDVRAEPLGDLRDQSGAPEAGHLDVVDGLGAAVVRAGHPDLHMPDPLRWRRRLGAQPGDRVDHGGDRIGGQIVHSRLHAGTDRAGQIGHRGGE
jgi:hypothetical protein